MGNVHLRHLFAEEVFIPLDNLGNLKGCCLGNIALPVHKTSSHSVEHKTNPSEGSIARFRLFNRLANASAFRHKSVSSNPK
jgi:hypothetical protein